MKRKRRRSLSESERNLIFEKTQGHCHICGAPLEDYWTADHVVPHAAGGAHQIDNYLPACAVCNRLRWFYTPKAIHQILRLGIYARNEINKDTALGEKLDQLYKKRLASNQKRRKN